MNEEWKSLSLQDLVDPIETIDPRKEPDETFTYIDVSSVSRSTLSVGETTPILGVSAPSRARRLVREGDVIFATIRPTLKRIAQIPANLNGAICSTGFFVLRPKDIVVSRYLFYWLLGAKFSSAIEELQRGASYPAVSDGDVKRQFVSLPPLTEQKRIVAILDEAFAGIDAAVANTEKNLANARELFESYLSSVFGENAGAWSRFRLSQLGQITSSKRIFKKEYCSDGVPFFRTKEIKELANENSISQELFISESRFHEIKEKHGIPLEGDILMTAIGTIGEVYVVRKDDEFYFKDGNILWFKNFKGINPFFLKYALRSFVEKLKRLSHGSAYNALPIEKLKQYEIGVPDMDKQIELIEDIEGMWSESQRLKSNYLRKIDALQELKQCLLQKAFSGELTAENTTKEMDEVVA